MNDDELEEQIQEDIDRDQEGDTYDEATEDTLAHGYRLDYEEHNIRYSVIVQTRIPSNLKSPDGTEYRYQVITWLWDTNSTTKNQNGNVHHSVNIESRFFADDDEIITYISDWKDKRGWYSI